MWPDMTLGLLANDLNGRNERTDGHTDRGMVEGGLL